LGRPFELVFTMTRAIRRTSAALYEADRGRQVYLLTPYAPPWSRPQFQSLMQFKKTSIWHPENAATATPTISTSRCCDRPRAARHSHAASSSSSLSASKPPRRLAIDRLRRRRFSQKRPPTARGQTIKEIGGFESLRRTIRRPRRLLADHRASGARSRNKRLRRVISAGFSSASSAPPTISVLTPRGSAHFIGLR